MRWVFGAAGWAAALLRVVIRNYNKAAARTEYWWGQGSSSFAASLPSCCCHSILYFWLSNYSWSPYLWFFFVCRSFSTQFLLPSVLSPNLFSFPKLESALLIFSRYIPLFLLQYSSRWPSGGWLNCSVSPGWLALLSLQCVGGEARTSEYINKDPAIKSHCLKLSSKLSSSWWAESGREVSSFWRDM